jgi:hypothetical protein
MVSLKRVANAVRDMPANVAIAARIPMGLRAFVDAYQHGGNARVRQAGNQTALSALQPSGAASQ